MGGYKNAEGYSDPTIGTALSNIAQEERRQDNERLHKISLLMPIIRQVTDLAGFEIEGRITFVDKKTGRKYK